MIRNKIVLIEHADPGYDFIFSKQIKRFNYKIWRTKFPYEY